LILAREGLVSIIAPKSPALRYAAPAALQLRAPKARAATKAAIVCSGAPSATITIARTSLLREQSERLAQRVNLHLALGGDFSDTTAGPVAAR
jgi:hypothetical protein